ncbi:protein KRI1 homolog [Diachasmimorpha longicaudata]|uniref:protein KRI1 homolog n=1 Tax=Diachasmimorpha longicaudata TaxID=58733 RepID=UPI0030B8EA85
MSQLFQGDDLDSDEGIKINNGYANHYSDWRRKEELHKLKTKYGEQLDDIQSSEESDSSSGEDEEAGELTEVFEKDFYKTLASLKKKDPRIYDENVTFFSKPEDSQDAPQAQASQSKKRPKKEKPFTLRDYDRQMIMQRLNQSSGNVDDDDFQRKNGEANGLTYVEEQKGLRESINQILQDEEDGSDTGDDLLLPKSKTQEEKQREEESYKEWLKGQPREMESSDQQALKPLRDFWTDPNLDDNEKFLRDYVLNKKFLEKDVKNHDHEDLVNNSNENLSEDEKDIEQQEVFEHKFNFRFEEPDTEFLKRYPRTLENSLRKKDTRRSEKRAAVKVRKEEERARKREELKRLKAMKRKEIEEKIAQLKEITGNDDMKFDSLDLEGDFDPAEHDRKMVELFDEGYYKEGEEHVKPVFPDIDEELGVESTWDDYDPNVQETEPAEGQGAPHAEDDDFNMDADYDPVNSLQEELANSSRKKRKRRSKFAEMISKEKPKFDPTFHTSYKDYIDQYYGLDYEDMIGDMPCRFKYREVVPNDYGLSVEEILMADDRELNKWCSLKKALEHKPKHQEIQEVKIYREKSLNEPYKKKVLKSLYEELENSENLPEGSDENSVNKKKRRRKKGSQVEAVKAVKADVKLSSSPQEKTKDLKTSPAEEKVDKTENEEEPPKKKMKTERVKKNQQGDKTPGEKIVNGRKKLQKSPQSSQNIAGKSEDCQNQSAPREKKNKQRQKLKKSKGSKDSSNPLIASLGDERLKAYGIKPKKFKKKIKYGQQSSVNMKKKNFRGVVKNQK